MYVGSTALFGFINYLVCPVALLLAHGATRIDVHVEEGFDIRSDAVIPIERNEEGRIAPFQEIRLAGRGHSLEATVLNALSQELSVSVSTGAGVEELRFSRGVLTSERTTETPEALRGTTLRFQPDVTIFTVTNVSQTAFASYLRRLSYLHEGVRFTLTVSGDRQEYFAFDGITDLFTALAAPYQLMHEPMRIAAHEGGLDLQIILAYHSWKENHLWCFINNGRAVDGGTHEKGLVQALKRLKQKLELPPNFQNGVVAVAFMRYPGAVWEGCIKARIGNPELKPMVSRLVVNEVMKWLNNHPDVEAQVRKLETFHFPEVWSNSRR